uniref:NADH-ubiquinone oxidoreductase chain 1 n=1 Tax=Brettanomyces custersianus TaxID=13368 RepID=C7FEW4_BRECS|nr:Nad1p [Brettanomyces custersianus]ACU32821.1 Nad1p [Brettanomyces custersianus]
MKLVLELLERSEYVWYILLFILGVLLGVAYLTVAERKTMGYMQRRLGPNAVGYYGVLMAFADALKLLVKEIIVIRNGEWVYMVGAPLITLFAVLLSLSVIPFDTGLGILEGEYSIIFLLGTGSLGILGTVIAGWMSNSKYTVLASVRTTAQLISYELILTTVVFIMVLLVNSLNIETIIDSQVYINYVIPLLPLALIYFIGALAENARPPFDNIEAESELVSGHMTELSASPFVIFFLSEYTSMVLMSMLTSIFFFGGYLSWPFDINKLFFLDTLSFNNWYWLLEGLLFSSVFVIKTNFFLFTYIWVRASFPRLRFDLLILFCWYVLLPLLFAFCLFIPCLLYSFDSLTLIV